MREAQHRRARAEAGGAERKPGTLCTAELARSLGILTRVKSDIAQDARTVYT